MSHLPVFHPITDAWFGRRFGEPTPVQAAGWPVIAGGQRRPGHRADRLGQDAGGVPLCLDGLVRKAAAGDARRPHRGRLRLAAQGAVERHPPQPRGAARRAARAGGRAGRPRARHPHRRPHRRHDGGRAAAGAKRPPHVLVTTPESLYHPADLRVGPARRSRDVRTVIVDEIHAVARRQARRAPGALARAARARWSPRRAARRSSASASRRRCGPSRSRRGCSSARRAPARHRRRRPAARSRPRRRGARDELGAVCTNEQWAEIYDRIAALARAHRSTLVFVNTRRLVERVTLHLAERLGAGRRRRAPRQPVAPAALRRRAAAQGGRAHAWSSRPPRSSSASTSARSISSA